MINPYILSKEDKGDRASGGNGLLRTRHSPAPDGLREDVADQDARVDIDEGEGGRRETPAYHDSRAFLRHG